MTRTAGSVLGALATLILSACAALPVGFGGPSPGQSDAQTTSPVRAEALVVLAGRVGAMRLGTADTRAPDRGLGFVDAPGLPPTAAWLSTGGTTLAATTLAGMTLVSTHGFAWQPAPGELGRAHPWRAFGSIDPGADEIASIEGEPGSGQPGRLVVASLDGGSIATIAIAQAAESAPAWLPDGRVVLVVRDSSDRPRPLIAELATGRLAGGPGGPVRSVAIGGGTLATIDETGLIRTESVDDWLAGGPGSVVRSVGQSPGEVVSQAQPSPDGQELAEVFTNEDGDAEAIEVVAVDGHEIARLALPDGTNRAVVSWLAAP
jgi:hypothetical protein